MARRPHTHLLFCTLMLLLPCAAKAQPSSGWKSMESRDLKVGNYARIQFVYFFNRHDGVVAGDSGFIRYTDDGGETWQRPTSLPALALTPGRFAEDFHSGAWDRDGETLFLLSLQHLFITRDRGESWDLVTSTQYAEKLGIPVGPGARLIYSDVFFVNEEEGWLLCRVSNSGKGSNRFMSYVLHTNTGGRNWETYSKLPTERRMVQMYFANDALGWVVGEAGTILHTTNGGRDWKPQPYSERGNVRPTGPKPHLLNLMFRGKDEGIIVGQKGTILQTRDRGTTWERRELPPLPSGRKDYNDLIKVQFVDDSFAWVVGASGDILCTTNGGNTWYSQRGQLKHTLFSVHMLGRDRGWAGGDGKTLLNYDAKTGSRCGADPPRR